MKTIIKLLIILMLPGCAANSSVTSMRNTRLETDSQREQDYESLVEEVYARRSSIDFTQLRMAYIDSTGNQQGSEQINEIVASFNSKNLSVCALQVDKYLKINFASLAAHYLAFECRRQLGDMEKAQFHQYVLNGLMESISISGDGLSKESSYIVISAEEAKWYVQLLNMEIRKHDFIRDGKFSYIKLTIVDPANHDQFEFYFDISLQVLKGYKLLLRSADKDVVTSH